MKQPKVWWQLLVALTMLTGFFILIFYTDNKYQTPPPYGRSGRIELCEADLERKTPVFLIDGWLLTDDRVTGQPTYIGEFSNLQRGDLSVPPHGRAYYELTVCYTGPVRLASVDFYPQLSSKYTILLDGQPLAREIGSGRVTFFLTAGDHTLTVETVSELGYYSGMYFPPAFGTAETLTKISRVRGFSYALAFLFPLTLAVFTCALWRAEDRLARWFGVLCFSYALYMARYFVSWFSYTRLRFVAQYWFLAEDAAMYSLCFCVVQLTVLASGEETGRVWRYVRTVLLTLAAVLLGLCLTIPVFSWAVFLHGRLTDLYYLLTFGAASAFSLQSAAVQNRESRYTLTGCMVFGSGLLMNLLFSNRFEPIRFFWQFEWCGLLLALLFGAMMVSRSRRILRENDRLTRHLEKEVERRTEEVRRLLEERRELFSDMAHDLKAPVFATQSFLEAIRRSGAKEEEKLKEYLDQAEAKQWEMARRLQGLSTVNALDRIEEEWVRVSVGKMLSEMYSVYRGEAEVRSVHLTARLPEPDVFLRAQPEKLNILFENLIYNALKATPRDGKITIAAEGEDGRVRMTVEDTGCGIPKEELPFIFQRFYVGAGNRDTGTGLGLYIVHSIVAEMGGTIAASSAVGTGTTFVMEFPQDTESDR